MSKFKSVRAVSGASDVLRESKRPEPPNRKSGSRALQCDVFSRRTFFLGVGTVLLGIAVGCDGPPQVDPEVEKQAAAALRAAGARMSEDGGHIGKIDFSGKKVSDEDLANIGKLPLLQQLLLRGSTFDDASLAHLTSLKQIGQISLKESSVTDAGLEHIGKLSSLTQLDLEKTKITDAGLEHLKGLKNLERLYLGGSTATSTGAINLKEAIPDLSVSGP